MDDRTTQSSGRSMFLPDGTGSGRREMTTEKRQTGRARGLRGKVKEAAGRVDTAKLKEAIDDLKRSRDAAAAHSNRTGSAAVSEHGAGRKEECS